MTTAPRLSSVLGTSAKAALAGAALLLTIAVHCPAHAQGYWTKSYGTAGNGVANNGPVNPQPQIFIPNTVQNGPANYGVANGYTWVPEAVPQPRPWQAAPMAPLAPMAPMAPMFGN